MSVARFVARSVAALLLLVLVVTAQPACAQRTASQGPPLRLRDFSEGFEDLASRATGAVVQVVSSGYGAASGSGPAATVLAKQRSGGSGVLLSAEGDIITNAHVIEGARRVQVLLPQRVESPISESSILKARPKLREARVLGIDAETDLAVLRIDETNLPYLELGDSDMVRQGQIVFAFGSPLGLENSVTMGVVSSVARQLETDSPMIYIQTDTAINPGNSGGPLLNTEGEVIGINTLIFSQSGGNEGVGFAAPSNIVRHVYKQIRQHGAVRRGEIGVHAQTITPLLAAGLGLARDWGVILGDVKPGGPGDIAGLQIGDVVLSMNGKVMENGRQFQVNLYQRSIGDVVKLQVVRNGEPLTISVAVLDREDDPSRFARLVSGGENLIPQLGIMGLDLNREMRSMVPGLRRSSGVVVAALVADGPYWKVLFQPGDAIYAVNGTAVHSLRDLRAALVALDQGEPVVVQLERRGRMLFIPFELE